MKMLQAELKGLVQSWVVKGSVSGNLLALQRSLSDAAGQHKTWVFWMVLWLKQELHWQEPAPAMFTFSMGYSN